MTKNFEYDYFYSHYNECMMSLEALRDNGHPLFSAYDNLLHSQKIFLDLMQYHREATNQLGEDKSGSELNGRILNYLGSRIAKNDVRIKTLFSRMTRKKADRKAYYKKYYNEHRREIAARNRSYDKSKYEKKRKTSEELLKQYIFQHKDRFSLLERMGRFFSFDKGGRSEYFLSLKRAIKNIPINYNGNIKEQSCDNIG